MKTHACKTSGLGAGRASRRAVSLLEMLAAVSVLGVIAAVAFVRTTGAGNEAGREACFMNKAFIETQAQLWYREKGSWPATNLSDMASDSAYLPEGLPTCPLGDPAYSLDAQTHRVTGHDHP